VSELLYDLDSGGRQDRSVCYRADTSVGTPKAGVFAEGQAIVVAGQISAQKRGTATPAAYDGRGICYLELGHNMVAKVDVTFASGQSPVGDLEGPSADLVADKVSFGSQRASRWFGTTWHATQADPPPA
jgi:sulfide:quinone oxidoreductase